MSRTARSDRIGPPDWDAFQAARRAHLARMEAQSVLARLEHTWSLPPTRATDAPSGPSAEDDGGPAAGAV